MAKPILLSVDDDSDVLRAIERDLRSKYGADYRVIASDSPEQALNLLGQLKVRNDSVALLLADQRMPHMDGVAFLQEGMRIFPEAKRALLTAYADTNAAISAINEANINYFFLKPWDPPTEHLYPQLDDLLDDWRASYRPAFEGIRVLGTRWSPRSYDRRIPRLQEKVVDVCFIDGADGCVCVGIGGEQRPLRVGENPHPFLQECDAIHVGHALVGEQQRHAVVAHLQLPQQVQRLLGRIARDHAVIGAVLRTQVAFDRSQNIRVVIHTQ